MFLDFDIWYCVGGSNKKASFISDNIIHSSRIQSPTDFENHLISEEEDMEGFLMIKPIKTGTSHPKQHQPIKSQNFCLSRVPVLCLN